MKQNGKILDVSRTHDTCRRRKTAGQIDGRQEGGAGRRSCRGAGTPAPITYPLASGLRCTAASVVAVPRKRRMTLRSS